MLQAYVSKCHSNWEYYLPILEFAYNSTKHVTTGFSPFMLMYGFQPRSPVTVGLATEKIQQVKDFLQDHMDMLQLAWQNIQQAQDRYKKFLDTHQRPITFKEGQLVFFRVSKNLQSLKIGRVSKLSPRFCGPFKIIKRKVRLPINLSYHPPVRFMLCFVLVV